MTTDYGYGCQTCGLNEKGEVAKQVVIDNYRDPKQLNRWLEDLVLLESIAVIDKSNLIVRPDSNFSFGELFVHNALLFAAQHVRRGHTVRVIDEYGHWEDNCFKKIACQHCDTERWCCLKKNHLEPCRSK